MDEDLMELARELLVRSEGQYDSYEKFVIPNKYSRPLIAIRSIENDLAFVKKYLVVLNRLNELVSPQASPNSTLDDIWIIKSSLWQSSIIMYGKCFTDAKRSRSTKLEASECFSLGDPELDIHKKIMGVRHNYIAHRGDTHHEKAVALRLVSNTQNQHHEKIEVINERTISQAKSEIDNFLLVVDHLLKYVDKKFKERSFKAHKALLSLSNEDITSCKLD